MRNATLPVFLLMTTVTCFESVSAEEISLPGLLEQMSDRERLASNPAIQYHAKLASSYDRKSKANNPADGLYVEKNGRDWGKGWFANYDFQQFIRIEERGGRQEYVIMEDNGPGVLVRWWMVRYNRGKIRVYLDGGDQPTIEMPAVDMVGGNGLVVEPFSFLASDDETNPDWRGRNLYLPIPYQSDCKVTIDQQPEYYQINYNSYPAGTKVKTFRMEQLQRNAALIEKIGNNLIGGSRNIGGKTLHQSGTLKPGEAIEMSINESAAIHRLRVRLSAADYQQALRSTVIEMNFDGKDTLWMPVGALGGVGYSQERNQTYYITTDPDKGLVSSYYVMPFQKQATIRLVNHGKQDVKIGNLSATIRPHRWNTDNLYFHGTWFELRNISTQNRSDLNYVKVKGTGRYVGTSITIFNTCTLPDNQTWWGEGDDKVYVDGETFPSIFGTGTEDYFGYAFCRPQRYNLPFISQPRGEGNKKWGYTNNNRYHFLDDIPFKESLQFDMEIWHPFRKNMNYAVATFFYASSESTHNKKPVVDSVRHKVALHRDDVISVETP